MEITQQYHAGELSILLGELAELAASPASPDRLGEIERMRHETEESPTTVLDRVAMRALDVADELCWESVTRGDTAAFRGQAVVSARIYEFGVCAGLLAQGHSPASARRSSMDGIRAEGAR